MTTLDDFNLFKVGTIARILVISRNSLVFGSIGLLISTRSRTVLPEASISDKVKTFAIIDASQSRFLIPFILQKIHFAIRFLLRNCRLDLLAL